MLSKQLKFVITLGTGKFGSSDNNVITLQGFRASADISKAGGQMMGTLSAQIYGVKLSDINSITTLQWKPRALIANTVQVYAIEGAQETLVFQGNIINAWGNFQSMPDVSLQVQAQSAYFAALTPQMPRSYKGQIDVATVVSQIARSMGYNFENNGVNVQLTDVYLNNTGLDQVKAICRAAAVTLYIDDNVLAICPLGVARGSLVPKISPETGMIGYPTFDGVGVNFQILFNPAVTFGGRIEVDTSIKQAAGTWIVTSLSHKLQSETPDGAWFTTVRGNSIGLAISK